MRYISLLPLVGLALAAPNPTKTLAERATSLCDQWSEATTSTYILYNDLWGESEATSGSQCTYLEGISSGYLEWYTDWTWSGGSSDVKSYANAAITGTSKLSAISSISTVWDWSYSGSDIVADVSYDIYLGTSTSASSSYEIMIWLDALGGAGPISSSGSAVATPTIDSVSWKLYSGANGDMTVYSFVATSAQTAFSGDIMDFMDYLVSDYGVSTSLYLTSIGAGTEAFTGSSAVFTTSKYKCTIST